MYLKYISKMYFVFFITHIMPIFTIPMFEFYKNKNVNNIYKIESISIQKNQFYKYY